MDKRPIRFHTLNQDELVDLRGGQPAVPENTVETLKSEH